MTRWRTRAHTCKASSGPSKNTARTTSGFKSEPCARCDPPALGPWGGTWRSASNRSRSEVSPARPPALPTLRPFILVRGGDREQGQLPIWHGGGDWGKQALLALSSLRAPPWAGSTLLSPCHLGQTCPSLSPPGKLPILPGQETAHPARPAAPHPFPSYIHRQAEPLRCALGPPCCQPWPPLSRGCLQGRSSPRVLGSPQVPRANPGAEALTGQGGLPGGGHRGWGFQFKFRV